MRNFEVVGEKFRKFPEEKIRLPERATSQSACYDFYSNEDVDLWPGEFHTFYTDVKVRMFFDNVLQIYTRSGNGCKRGLVLRNGTGIVDADYVDNEVNDGNIAVCLINRGEGKVSIKKGDKIAQGCFVRYLITDDDKFMNSREEASTTHSGFGSTGV